MQSRKHSFIGAATVGEMIQALDKFPMDAEVMVAVNEDVHILSIKGVSDNRDYGSKNDIAFVEVQLDKKRES